MKKELVGVNHLKEVANLLGRAINLLNQGKHIYPYAVWQDTLSTLKDEIKDHIDDEEKLNVGE